YGIAGASVRHNNPAFSLSAAAAATPEKLAGFGANRSNHGQEADRPQSPEPYNFLGEFNATYSYFFGSPPSESILESQIAKGGYKLPQDSGLLSPSSVARATPDEKPRSNPTTSEEEGFETAVGSDDGSSSDEDDNSADDSSADSSSSVHDEALEEERRKEEERKAAELRSRRREVIKQQVAFERMKERHRRQYPGQQSSSGLHNNVARWQKESARAAVKLASTPKKIRNPYLSDSSDGSDVTSTSSSGSSSNLSNGDNNSSDETSSAGGSDISCESIPLVVAHKLRGFSNNNTDSTRAKAESNVDSLAGDSEVGAASRLHKTISDSSSDASAKSQSSSKRRVRFHETVSVVFNTRRSIAEEDTENDVYGSDSNSSDASMDVSIDRITGHQAANRSTGVSWLESDAKNSTSSKSTSEQSSRNISPDGVKSRSRRSPSRIKTEPLRDHEAEREQQQQKQHQDQKQRQQKMQQQAHAIGKQVGKENTAGSESNSTSQSGSNYAATATIAKAATNTSSLSAVGATEPAQPTVDRVAEARRALLGHYHTPNPSVPVGPGIPRSSGAKPVYTSSVKVVRPQSFSRPKKAYSRGGSAFSPEKPAERTRSFADRKNKPQGQIKMAGTPDTISKHKFLEEAPREDDHNSSQEFELSNVLQNFSIASFEVTKAKDGGMHINYSNRNKSQPGASSFKRDDADSEDDDDSDGDELPLSAIVRSKSEPARYPAHRPVVSGEMSRRVIASEARVSRSSGNSTNNSPNTSPPLFGRASTDQSRRVLVRNQSLAKERTAFDHVIGHDEMSRSVSMDGGPRNPHSQKKHNEGKGRFSRFGGFFS
ncbi:hypothetical protein GGI11_002055, partial [Coemansia sp. RSA 2049]